jgi:hypothetical protein
MVLARAPTLLELGLRRIVSDGVQHLVTLIRRMR